MFQCFVSELNQLQPPPRTVLELGSGPGFLAEQILFHCPSVESYYPLDFSGVMHVSGRSRLRQFAERLSSFTPTSGSASWLGAVPGTPDVVVSMESAVYELRNKHLVPRLYTEIASILAPQGTLLVCDFLPGNQPEEERSLYMQPHEQMTAFAAAGFHERGVRGAQMGLALYRAQLDQAGEAEKIDEIDEKPCQTPPDACK